MSGVCDTRLDATWRDTPNFQPRRNGLKPALLIMHYTGMESAGAALDLLCNEHSNVSCHYLVEENGDITQMVGESQRAWHAGHSHWAGEDDINSSSIGIEIVNEGHGRILKGFPDRQIAAVMELSKDIIERHSIQPRNVIGHSDIAPARKKDPGEKFPWGLLFENGIGHYVTPAPLAGDQGAGPGDEGGEIRNVQKSLLRYGYLINTDGRFTQRTSDVVTAFQRHFRPDRIDGRLDQSTITTLAQLIDRLPETVTGS